MLVVVGCAGVGPEAGPGPGHDPGWGALATPSTSARGGRSDGAARVRPEGWRPLSSHGAPDGREDHTAIWTGSVMIVWGGETRGGGVVPVDTGAVYSPEDDAWTPMSRDGAPDPRDDHAVVWTGEEMIVWGGNQADEDSELLASGGRYQPGLDRWIPTALGPLSPRDDPTAIWTGKEMIVWGGRTFGGRHERSGASYDPTHDVWRAVPEAGAPDAREDHTAVWTGEEMIVWGGVVRPRHAPHASP